MKIGKKAISLGLMVFIVAHGLTFVSAGSNGGAPLQDRLLQV